MATDTRLGFVLRRPGVVVAFWFALALGVGLAAPDLTKRAAEGQAKVLGPDAESRRAGELIAQVWPHEAYESLAVAALFRPDGLTDADRAYARRLASAFEGPGRPHELLRVLGPNSDAEVAARLVSRDGSVSLIALPLSTHFVLPATHGAVRALRAVPGRPGLAPPDGLQIRWTGDAVIGRDYMAGVQTSLDRAAIATVVLLLIVLMAVYRSLWLALVPLATIGVSLVIARGVLAWMTTVGWELSSLVELFLVAVLFGSGTDFCLFVSWRFAEAWDPTDPVGAMRATLKCSVHPLLTSAGTVIVGLSLMGVNHFKLFSATGPSVAIGLALTLAATLTLTPALLVLLAKWRPQAFRGFTAASTGVWDRLGRAAMARPLQCWFGALVVMAPLAVFGLRSHVVQDILTELPVQTPSAQAYRLISKKFEPGALAPLTVVLESRADLSRSEGLAMIDDLSRALARRRDVDEVRSATQPLGTRETLGAARIDARLGAISAGFGELAAGAGELERGLSAGAVKLRAALWLENKTGLSLLGGAPPTTSGKGVDPRSGQVDELLKAAEGAGKIAQGAARARRELAVILHDPVGRRALDRLLVDPGTVADHPEIRRSFETYLSPDGHLARIDVAQSVPVFSTAAMDGVDSIRAQVKSFLADAAGPHVSSTVGGSNADSADVRALTRADMLRSWFVIPFGVFLVLLASLRDPLACLNLVATMLLTYAFALGATHLVFVTGLGAEGLDWKVPFFLFVLLVAVGVDYNVFLMSRLNEEASVWGLRPGIVRAIGQTGGLITSAAAITACSFASFLASPLSSLRQLGFSLVVGIMIDALLVRPFLVPCGHWLIACLKGCPLPPPSAADPAAPSGGHAAPAAPAPTRLATVAD